MEVINVNLASAKYQNKSRAYLIMTLAAVAVILLSLFNVGFGFRYHRKADEYDRKIKQLAQNRAKPHTSHGNRSLGEEAKSKIRNDSLFLNRLIEEDIFPWNHLLDIFERNIPAEIILTRFNPSERFDKITLEGSANSMEDIALLRNNLKSSELFGKVEIAHVGFRARDMETPMGEGDPGIEFKIECVLNLNLMIPEMDSHGIDAAPGGKMSDEPQQTD